MKTPVIYLVMTQVSVWEERVDDASFRDRVFLPLIRHLKRRGWTVKADPRIMAHHRCLTKYHRVAHKGDLQAALSQSGRVVEFEIWQDRFGITHPNGGKYEFNKRGIMPPWLGRRCDLELAKVSMFLSTLTGHPVRDRRHIGETADERIARGYRECWHTKPELGRAAFTNGDRDRKSADGHLLEQGQVVWVRSYSGRWLRGRAFYNLNNMWLVKVGPFDLMQKANFEIFATVPVNPREKRHPLRKQRLERRLAEAVKDSKFLRAHVIHGVLTNHLAASEAR